MNLHLVAPALTVLGLSAIASTAAGQVVDTTSPGNSNFGGMFSNRPALGATLTPGSSSLFGARAGTTTGSVGGMGQSPGFAGRGNGPAADASGSGTQGARRFVGAVQAGAAARGANVGGAAAELLLDTAIAGARRPVLANAAAGMMAGQQGGQAAPRIPATLRVAFEFAPQSAGRISTQLARRLTGTRAIHSLAPIQVELQGRTAILRGQVESEHDRDLAEQMARLEAGIDQVYNEIVVAGSSPAMAPAAAKPGNSSSSP